MKKTLGILFDAATIFLSSTAIAVADPISGLIVGLSSTLAAGGIGAAVLKVGIFVALSVGKSLLTKALTKKQTVPGINGQMKIGGDNPLSFIVGTYATAGTLEYVNTSGKAGKTPNAYLTQVISLSDFPVDSLSSILWVNGQKCEIDFAGGLDGADQVGYKVNEFIDNGQPYLWVRFHDGHSNVGDTFLYNKFNSDSVRPWSNDMIGEGIAYAVITARVNRELLPGVPQCRFGIRGARLYDPRKDSTNGGSGAHRWDNQATWEWTDNPVVIIYNILRGIYYDGEWFYGLQKMIASRLPVGNWFAGMNECDRLITNADGSTEKQYRCGTEISCDQEPLQIIDELRKSCNARIAEIGGVYKILVGAAAMPVYAMTDETVAVTEGQNFTPFPGLESLYNGVHATYPEPEENWGTKDAPPIYRSDLEAQDDNRRLMADATFPYVPFSRQVQRLSKAMIETERRFRTLKWTLPPELYEYEPLDTISVTSAENGFDDKYFLIESMDDGDNGNQGVAVREVDPADYDWNAGTDERPTVIGSLDPIRPAPQYVQDFQVFPYTQVDSGGKSRRPAILLVWNGEEQDEVIGVQYRIRKSSSLVFDYMGQTLDVPKGDHIISEFVLASQPYIVNARWIGAEPNREFQWGDALPVTAPNVLLGSQDIIVELQAVQNDMRNVLEGLRDDLQHVQDKIERVATDAATGTGQNIVDRKVIAKAVANATSSIIEESRQRVEENLAMSERTTLLQSKVTDPVTGNDALSTALFTLNTVVDGQGEDITALAEAILDVEASVGDISAGGLISFKVQIPPPAGVLSQINILARANTASAFIQSGMVIQVYDSGGGVLKSKILMLTDQFVIWDGTTQNLPFVYAGGVLKLAVANIGLVTAGMIQSANGKLQIDLDNVRILMSD
ncbi:phage tail protein [Phyllobacterium endophyticum]|uniref:Phage tail protein n=1 Tax=Phyllobacterium endophyticum TaxID=1149773 RepID=A0A2P7AUR0_9HYPH|nr:phage tail protein [Phyllobacterium endophyticum]MBB3234447.1 hypothetical protein [Phyllobacterium endophyticum]PSH57955.1 phage tail protein [Phyllobacterium endophyticum]TYR44163.1 phage tail protein [Phyllobacterium endophyticum]